MNNNSYHLIDDTDSYLSYLSHLRNLIYESIDTTIYTHYNITSKEISRLIMDYSYDENVIIIYKIYENACCKYLYYQCILSFYFIIRFIALILNSTILFTIFLNYLIDPQNSNVSFWNKCEVFTILWLFHISTKFPLFLYCLPMTNYRANKKKAINVISDNYDNVNNGRLLSNNNTNNNNRNNSNNTSNTNSISTMNNNNNNNNNTNNFRNTGKNYYHLKNKIPKSIFDQIYYLPKEINFNHNKIEIEFNMSQLKRMNSQIRRQSQILLSQRQKSLEILNSNNNRNNNNSNNNNKDNIDSSNDNTTSGLKSNRDSKKNTLRLSHGKDSGNKKAGILSDQGKLRRNSKVSKERQLKQLKLKAVPSQSGVSSNGSRMTPVPQTPITPITPISPISPISPTTPGIIGDSKEVTLEIEETNEKKQRESDNDDDNENEKKNDNDNGDENGMMMLSSYNNYNYGTNSLNLGDNDKTSLEEINKLKQQREEEERKRKLFKEEIDKYVFHPWFLQTKFRRIIFYFCLFLSISKESKTHNMSDSRNRNRNRPTKIKSVKSIDSMNSNNDKNDGDDNKDNDDNDNDNNNEEENEEDDEDDGFDNDDNDYFASTTRTNSILNKKKRLYTESNGLHLFFNLNMFVEMIHGGIGAFLFVLMQGAFAGIIVYVPIFFIFSFIASVPLILYKYFSWRFKMPNMTLDIFIKELLHLCAISSLITIIVCTLCLFDGQNWSNCFEYGIKGNYCLNSEKINSWSNDTLFVFNDNSDYAWVLLILWIIF